MKALVNGYIRAIAEDAITSTLPHPLQTRLQLILTDFLPNNNDQGIPIDEADNILKTAQFSPLKIRFSDIDQAYYGHETAIPIGPIINPQRSIDNGREIIVAEAVIWNDLYEEIAEHLKNVFDEGISTSWEIYFSSSEKKGTVDWLHGCVFAGTCIVSAPAYGPTRTRILAIAEKMRHNTDRESDMANTVDTQVSVQTTESETTVAQNTTEDVSTLRNDISTLLDILSSLYNGLYQMIEDSYELETQLTVTDMGSVAEQFVKLVNSVTKQFEALKNQANVATSELQIMKESAEKDRISRIEAERKKTIADLGIEWSDERATFFLGMSEYVWDQYCSDLQAIRQALPAKASSAMIIPEPTQQTTSTIDIHSLAAIFKSRQ